MIVYLVAMIVILAVVAGIVGVVLVGLEGRGGNRLDRYPKLAQFLTNAAQHLNGEGAAEQQQPRTSAQPELRVRERV